MKMYVLPIKKKTVLISFVLFFAGIFAGDFLLTRYSIKGVVAMPLSDVTVLIDPGHGSFDSGASANGAVEKEINLAVGRFLQNYIECNGGVAYLTRYEDVSTALPESERNISMKLSDMRQRKAEIEKVNADIFVSIHMNKFPQSQYKGAQTFFDSSSEDSKKLAENIQQAMADILDKNNKRTAKGTGDGIFVLKNNKIPSVLVECGFLSNEAEAELLKSADYQKKVAWSIYAGITRFVMEIKKS